MRTVERGIWLEVGLVGLGGEGGEEGRRGTLTICNGFLGYSSSSSDASLEPQQRNMLFQKDGFDDCCCC